MELISRIELETSPLPRECSTAELYEQILVNQQVALKKISRHSTKELAVVMNYL